jgi:hypothetical protein
MKVLDDEYTWENFEKKIKLLKELYELMNNEIEILNTMIEIVVPEQDYKKIREKAILLIQEREEDE